MRGASAPGGAGRSLLERRVNKGIASRRRQEWPVRGSVGPWLWAGPGGPGRTASALRWETHPAAPGSTGKRSSVRRTGPAPAFGIAEGPARQGAVRTAAPPRLRAQKRSLSSPHSGHPGVRSPSVALASPPSWQTTSRKGDWGAPVPGWSGPRGPGSSALRSRCPSLTHLMLFHHFAEAGIPLRDPSVELGDSHFDCQH